jgi:hypothetical protein
MLSLQTYAILQTYKIFLDFYVMLLSSRYVSMSNFSFFTISTYYFTVSINKYLVIHSSDIK